MGRPQDWCGMGAGSLAKLRNAVEAYGNTSKLFCSRLCFEYSCELHERINLSSLAESWDLYRAPNLQTKHVNGRTLVSLILEIFDLSHRGRGRLPDFNVFKCNRWCIAIRPYGVMNGRTVFLLFRPREEEVKPLPLEKRQGPSAL